LFISVDGKINSVPRDCGQKITDTNSEVSTPLKEIIFTRTT